MRTIRALTMAAAVVAAVPAIVSAQAGRQFKDSWFWGLKAGGFTLADSGQKYIHAPTIGLEWLITRTHGGLYISGAQTFFTQHTFTLRDPVSIDSGFRPIAIKNMRRLDIAVMGFPGEHLGYHPYGGVGFSVGQIGTAVPEGLFANIDQLNYAAAVIQEEKVAITPILLAGIQWRVRYFSVFGQLSGSPAQRHFIAYNGRPWNFAYEAGIRYNVGTAIAKND